MNIITSWYSYFYHKFENQCLSSNSVQKEFYFRIIFWMLLLFKYSVQYQASRGHSTTCQWWWWLYSCLPEPKMEIQQKRWAITKALKNQFSKQKYFTQKGTQKSGSKQKYFALVTNVPITQSSECKSSLKKNKERNKKPVSIFIKISELGRCKKEPYSLWTWAPKFPNFWQH